jgi:uncharacterized membrane protein
MVPLSEHEQRLFDQIEQALLAEDPKFAASVRSARPRNRARTLLALSVVGVVAGIAVVLVGLTANVIAVGVLGFVLIVSSCGVAAATLRGPRGVASASAADAAKPASAKPRSSNLKSKMEDRMRRRFEES